MKYLFLLIGVFFISVMYGQVSPVAPDSVWGTWKLDSMIVGKTTLDMKRLGKVATIRILANGMLRMQPIDQPEEWYSYTFSPQEIRLLESGQRLPLRKLSRQRMEISAQEGDQSVQLIYRKL